MTNEDALVSPEQMKSLARRLERCPQISRLNHGEHHEAWTLVHALSDLGGSCGAYLDILPSLLDDSLEGEELVLRLIDVANELSHVLYHIEDPQFFREFLEPLRDDWEQTRGVQDRGPTAR
jgi:hypothetical protein